MRDSVANSLITTAFLRFFDRIIIWDFRRGDTQRYEIEGSTCCHDMCPMSSPRKRENQVKADYKARLEYKLYLARENPEPVFDVSECALKNVPSGIYSLCKVFRKQALYMQCNRLNSLSGGGALRDLSLLTILDLHSNQFSSLPSEIKLLTSLKELYLHENLLKYLPEEISCLTQLQVLNVSKNVLKSLPNSFAQLKNLTTLDIGNNKNLKTLPKSLGHVQKLQDLGMENLNLTYPGKEISSGGVAVIVAFLANECGIAYFSEDNVSESKSQVSPKSPFEKENEVQEKKNKALLRVEREIWEQQQSELELQSMMKLHKEKLLEDLASQQVELEKEIGKVQLERDVNRTGLISMIYNAEKLADNVIKEFLQTSEEERQTQARLLEQEQQEEMRILSQSHSEQFSFRKRDTLLAMEEFLESELWDKKFAEYTKFRDCTAQSLLSLEIRNNKHVAQVMQSQEKSRQDLVNRLSQDEELQKVAVAVLLERSDTRSWAIVQQVNLVQSQLAALTNVELEKRNYEMNQQLNDIADRRMTLSAILVDLLSQQEKRRQELLETIRLIEGQRNVDYARKNSSFWLMQYQSLMEARPQGLLETLEPTLVRHVAIAGALHCLPFLSSLPSLLPNLDSEKLRSIGIVNETDQEAIKLAVENYLAEKKVGSCDTATVPTAPIQQPSTRNDSMTDPQEDLPNHGISECVVCMGAQCNMIFLPCGHMCCCINCSNNIASKCPMCRTTIERRVRFHTP